MGRWIARGVLLGSGWLLLLVALAGPAQAHAILESSSPLDGAQLSAAPSSVSVSFDESVGLDGGYLRVVDATGRRVDTGTARHPDGHDDTVEVRLRTGLGTSAYLVSYRVISADSHPVAGSVRFTVGDASGIAPPRATPDRGDGTTAVLDAVRGVSYLGLVAAGGTWLALVGPRPNGATRRRARRTLTVGGAVLVLTAAAEIWVQGAYAAGQWSALGSARTLGDTLHSGFGAWHLLQILAVVLTVVLARPLLDGSRGRGRTAAAAAAAVLGALALAAPGHASTPPLSPLAIASTTVHVLAVAAWIGGLGWLVVSWRRRDDVRRLRRVLPTFSAVALACVSTLTVTGVFQAVRLLQAWSPVVDTTYGRLALLKLTLLIVITGLASVSRTVVRARMTDDAQAGRWLRRGVGAEAGVAVVVLAITAVLTAEPPRTAAAEHMHMVGSVSQSAQVSAERSVIVTVSPGTAGPVTVTVDLSPGPAVQKLTVTATNPSAGIGPLPVALGALRDGQATATGVLLPHGGQWRFDLTVQTSAFDATVASVVVTLA